MPGSRRDGGQRPGHSGASGFVAGEVLARVLIAGLAWKTGARCHQDPARVPWESWAALAVFAIAAVVPAALGAQGGAGLERCGLHPRGSSWLRLDAAR